MTSKEAHGIALTDVIRTGGECGDTYAGGAMYDITAAYDQYDYKSFSEDIERMELIDDQAMVSQVVSTSDQFRSFEAYLPRIREADN